MDALWNVFLHHGLRNWRVESVMQGRTSAVAGFWIARCKSWTLDSMVQKLECIARALLDLSMNIRVIEEFN
jgi:hypothetical protein